MLLRGPAEPALHVLGGVADPLERDAVPEVDDVVQFARDRVYEVPARAVLDKDVSRPHQAMLAERALERQDLHVDAIDLHRLVERQHDLANPWIVLDLLEHGTFVAGEDATECAYRKRPPILVLGRPAVGGDELRAI